MSGLWSSCLQGSGNSSLSWSSVGCQAAGTVSSASPQPPSSFASAPWTLQGPWSGIFLL